MEEKFQVVVQGKVWLCREDLLWLEQYKRAQGLTNPTLMQKAIELLIEKERK